MTRYEFFCNVSNLTEDPTEDLTKELLDALEKLCCYWQQCDWLTYEMPSSIIVPISINRGEAEKVFQKLDLIVTDVSITKTDSLSASVIEFVS